MKRKGCYRYALYLPLLLCCISLLHTGCARVAKAPSHTDPAVTVSVDNAQDNKTALITELDNRTGITVYDKATQVIDAPVQFPYHDYRFQPGDKIEVSVWGEPDMTRDVVVLPDGTVSYFLIGEVQAVGRTFNELRAALEKKLSKYILHPQVTLIGKSFAGTFVTILGAVNRPGRHEVSQTDRVLDVIARAEGLKYVSSFSDDFSYAGEIANLKLAYLSRANKLVDVDFVALIDDGDMSQNIQVFPGDFLYIPSSLSEQIYVLGEVQAPTTVPYRAKTTLLEAIASAEGFVENTACKSSICIISGSLRQPQIAKVDFDDILKGKIKNIILNPGDIVYVPSTFVTDIERISSQVIPFLDTIIRGDSVLDIGQRRWKTWNPYRGQ